MQTPETRDSEDWVRENIIRETVNQFGDGIHVEGSSELGHCHMENIHLGGDVVFDDPETHEEVTLLVGRETGIKPILCEPRPASERDRQMLDEILLSFQPDAPRGQDTKHTQAA